MDMRVVRRICQVFFLALFLWLCTVMTLGTGWRQLRGWPVNWFLQIDPLVGLGTLLSTGRLYAGMLWSLAVVCMTLAFGRFFCGWVCPLGTCQQAAGYAGRRTRSLAGKVAVNQYHGAQNLKYWILAALIAAAAGSGMFQGMMHAPLFLVLIVCIAIGYFRGVSAFYLGIGLMLFWALVAGFQKIAPGFLQIGLLDPICLMQRFVNFVMLPLVDSGIVDMYPGNRFYALGWFSAAMVGFAVAASVRIPRFYCRYVCPLGALFGLISQASLWTLFRKNVQCRKCRVCEKDCEGACEPSDRFRVSECVLCLNCMASCPDDEIRFGISPGRPLPIDLERRRLLGAVVLGVAAGPVARLDPLNAAAWNPELVRPPGSLDEAEFLSRCVKCGQCVRICPTNVIQPAGIEYGFSRWATPVLNFRAGASGCQLNCIACGHLCPTAAIRPLGLDEKKTLRIGTAFVDWGRCLPWAMDRPCIVCQETCPVSPKAISTRIHFSFLDLGPLAVEAVDAAGILLKESVLTPDQLATGDYYCVIGQDVYSRILANTDRLLVLEDSGVQHPVSEDPIRIAIRLQRPVVDPNRCIGCGICQHECPVRGKPAICVTAENESRHRSHAMLIAAPGSGPP